MRKIPVLRLNIPRHSAWEIFRLLTGIFRKYPSLTWYISIKSDLCLKKCTKLTLKNEMFRLDFNHGHDLIQIEKLSGRGTAFPEVYFVIFQEHFSKYTFIGTRLHALESHRFIFHQILFLGFFAKCSFLLVICWPSKILFWKGV